VPTTNIPLIEDGLPALKFRVFTKGFSFIAIKDEFVWL